MNVALAARCLMCGHQWAAVVPVDADPTTLECPRCARQTSIAIDSEPWPVLPEQATAA